MFNKASIYSLTLPELEDKCQTLNLKKFNAKQIFQWIYKKQITTFDQMSNIAKDSLETLNKNFEINCFKTVKLLIDDRDETTKFLYELNDDEKIETVLMKFDYGYGVCISSQVGCNMGCKFCASGLLKKKRNLTTDEMVLQYVQTQQYLTKLNNQRISNMVVMGIGEPFDNYENLSNALKILNDQWGVALGSRHITVSTCGVVPMIEKFGKDFNQINLAISLHAANDELRNQLMPINKAYNLHSLMTATKKYLSITNRRISFEYILLENINDKPEHVKQLVKLLKGVLCYVNIILYNNVAEHHFKPSRKIKWFVDELMKDKIMVTKRLERGTKIAAACGQLRAKHEK